VEGEKAVVSEALLYTASYTGRLRVTCTAYLVKWPSNDNAERKCLQ